ncbi:hypothetical protein JL721_3295 [Aureococcus anophagefferens]|nr:hypothetical protein JL721_3295 [Aureococcus anophagefferens]
MMDVETAVTLEAGVPDALFGLLRVAYAGRARAEASLVLARGDEVVCLGRCFDGGGAEVVGARLLFRVGGDGGAYEAADRNATRLGVASEARQIAAGQARCVALTCGGACWDAPGFFSQRTEVASVTSSVSAFRTENREAAAGATGGLVAGGDEAASEAAVAAAARRRGLFARVVGDVYGPGGDFERSLRRWLRDGDGVARLLRALEDRVEAVAPGALGGGGFDAAAAALRSRGDGATSRRPSVDDRRKSFEGLAAAAATLRAALEARGARVESAFVPDVAEPLSFAWDLVVADAVFPMTPRDAAGLEAADLTAQLGLTRDDGAALAAAIRSGEAPPPELLALTGSLRGGQKLVAAAQSGSADAALREASGLAAALVAAFLESRYDTPVVEAEVLKGLQTASLRHAAAHLNEVLLGAADRVADVLDCRPPPWYLLGELCVASLDAAAKPPATSGWRQRKLAVDCAAIFAAGAAGALELRGCAAVPRAALLETAKPWDGARFLEDERSRYRASAQLDHGTIVNPITGEDLDIMQQCVSLRLEARDCELADAEAFDDVLSAFAEEVALNARVWARVADAPPAEARVIRVNGDGTFDVKPNGASSKTLRDVRRRDLEAEPLLVVGDPAGGKTTFAKQLLTWTMREPRHAYLIPCLVRVCDVVRVFAPETARPAAPLAWAYLRQTCAEARWRFFDKARQERRLLLILDGVDEAGALEREIRDEYARHPLVVTSREMKALEGPAYARFRRVRVLQLDQGQIEAIARKRLGDDGQFETFLGQLRLNAALQRMAANPLLLSVTLSVFQGEGLAGDLNRGLVYRTALTSMLDKLGDAPPGVARSLLRKVAWRAHSADGGRGTRDFGDDLVLDAVRDTPGVSEADWRAVADAAQRGRLPLLAWFSERGADKYRFAHLTFQEFLAAEQCALYFDAEADAGKGADAFAATFARLALAPGGRPSALFERGWWQQVVQMFGDLAAADDGRRRGAYVAALARALLGLESPGGAAAVLRLDGAVGDRNAMTLVSLLAETHTLGTVAISNGGLGAAAVDQLAPRLTTSAPTLVKLDLSGNLLCGGAVATLCDALRVAQTPALAELDVSANRCCVGAERRPGFERETFHSRKRGGSHRSKLYLDYVHAAWIPDIRGVEALAAFARATPSLRTLDARSNALTEAAGRALAALLDDCPAIEVLCGVPVGRLKATAPPFLKGGRRFYPATVAALRDDGAVDLAYVDAASRVVRRETNVPRRFVREAAGPPRAEAGGCVVLARALDHVASDDARAALEELRLPHQSLAFDMSVWNPPPQRTTTSARPRGAVALPRAHDTGMNPAGALELVAALRRCPKLRVVDCRDTLDAGVVVGAALADAARDGAWASLGLGACVLDVADLRAAPHARLRRSLKDAGVAAVAALAEEATRVTHVNGLDLRLFFGAGAAALLDLDLSAAHLNRASARMVLSLLAHCAGLEALNLSNADLMPSAHPHPMTPELFGNGHLCNACATHHALNVDLNLACQVCDNDACGAQWRSNDIVDDLADALRARGATLRRLALKNCCFTTMDGPIAVAPFERLGDVLGDDLPKLETVDVSGNEWSAPRLTRWCAEALDDGDDAGGDEAAATGGGDDDDEVRWHRRARLWQRVVELESSGSDDDRNDDDRAYSRKRLPVAAGFPALARGLARNPSLRTAAVSSRAALDLAAVRCAAADGGGVVDARAFFHVAGLDDEKDDEDREFWTNPHADLANLVLLVDAFSAASKAAATAYPRRLRVDLFGMPALCLPAAQKALIGAFPLLDRLEVGLLALDLEGLRTGDARALTLAAARTPEDLGRSCACGLLVAAAIRCAAKLEAVDARGVDLGAAAADARAARDHGSLSIDEDSLRLVFGFARSPRTLRLDARPVDALADLFPLASPAVSPEARDLVDKMESGDFDIANEDDLAEINGVLARLDEADQRSVTRSYWVLRQRAAAVEHQDQDLGNFVDGAGAAASSSSEEEEDDDEA